MRDIDVVDEGLFDASPAEVFDAVRDEAAGRAQWWLPVLEMRPRPGTTEVQEGTVVDVHVRGPLPSHFVARIAHVVPNERVRVEYTGGDFVGEGEWTFTPEAGRTRVRFRWHVRPHRLPVRLLSHVVDLGQRHSDTVQRGFAGLRRYLRAQQPVHVPPAPPPLHAAGPHA